VKGRNPFRIIATASGVLKRNLRVIVNNSDMRTIIACPPLKMTAMSRALKGCNVVLWEVASKSGKLDVADLISKAGLFGFRHILVEGGQRMATDLMSQGLIDRYIAIVSPTCIGDGIHAIGSMGIMAVNKAVRGTIVSSTMMGRDVVIEMRFRGKKEW
jgi:riboflavin biosynthesis pyrimidine reductase